MDFKIILFFALLIGGILSFGQAHASNGDGNYTGSHSTICADAPNGTIVMHDEVLMTDSGSRSNPVTKIHVYDANDSLVHTENNCNSSQCSTSLSALSAGTYFVKVFTENGSVFTGYVTLD